MVNIEINKNFSFYLSYLKTFNQANTKLGLNKIHISNSKAITRSRNATSSQVIFPFKDYIEENLNINIPVNMFKVTPEVINASHKRNLAITEHSNYDMSKLNRKRLIKASKICFELFGFNGLYKTELLSITESCNSYSNTTSSAYPLYRPKGEENVKSQTISWVNKFLQNPKLTDLYLQPVTIFHRFQYKNRNDNLKDFSVNGFVDSYKQNKLSSFDIDTKVRPVNALPYNVQTLEGVFFRNMLNTYVRVQSNSDEPLTTAGRSLPQISNDVISRLRNRAISSNSRLFSGDAENFDQNTSNFLIALFFANAREHIDFKLEGFSRENLLRSFNMLSMYYCHTPLLKSFNKDEIIKGKGLKIKITGKGLPSGSLITNFLGSFCTGTMLIYLLLEKSNDNISLQDISRRIKVLGDDNLLLLNNISPKHVYSIYIRFGYSINEDKSLVSNPKDLFPFLGYFWDIEDRPVQNIPWYIVHLILPSRFITVNQIPFSISELQTFRAISICCSLYKGYDIYKTLVGNKDYVYQKYYNKYLEGDSPTLYLVTEDQRNFLYRFPFDIIEKGWKAFGGMVQESLDNTSKINISVNMGHKGSGGRASGLPPCTLR